MSWEAGLAKVEITSFEQGMASLGWESAEHRLQGVMMPLHARALVVRSGDGRCFAYACAEVCLMTIAVRQAVLDRLAASSREWSPHNVMLTATHTHSGPSGYSHYAAYYANTQGFSPAVFDTIVDGIVSAITEARQRCTAAILRIGEATIAFEEPVAFNRSVDAYNRNRGVVPVSASRPERATARRSLSLRVDRAADGHPLGVVNWFAVHGTSLRADNTWLHPDNKGIAAHLFEQVMLRPRIDAPPFVAIFAQGAAGDVTPNSPIEAANDAWGSRPSGDLSLAARNGGIQYRHARQAFDSAVASPPLRGDLSFETRHVDMACVDVTPDFAGGRRDATTSQGVVGLRAACGTKEGPGPLRPASALLDALSGAKRRAGRLVDAPVDPKLPWLEVGAGANGRFLGLFRIRSAMSLVARRQHAIEFLHRADVVGALGDEPWVPRVVPIQVARLGRLLVCATPAEPTTIAGAELAHAVERACFVPRGATRPTVVVNGYANGYAGYVTTRREYELQRYEGASTLFGEWTLAGYQTVFDSMVRAGLHELHDAPVEGPALCLVPEAALVRQRQAGRGLDLLPVEAT